MHATTGTGVNRPWRAAAVKLSNRVDLQWVEAKPVTDASPGELAVSRPGTLAEGTPVGKQEARRQRH